MDIEKYRQLFLSEAAEHLQSMTGCLVAAESELNDQNGIDALFRDAHSIKGMAATMNYDVTARLAHHLEDCLAECRDQGHIASGTLDRLLEGAELLDGLLEDIAQGNPERDIEAFIAESGEQLEEPPVVAVEDDAQCDLVGEGLLVQLQLDDAVAAPGPRLLVLQKRLAEFGTIIESSPTEDQLLQGEVSKQLLVRLKTEASPEDIRQRLACYRELSKIDFPVAILEEQKTRKASRAGSTVRVDTELLDRFINLTGELITNRYMLQGAVAEKSWTDVNEGLGQLARLVKNLHHQVLQVRMMPLDSITGRLPLALRDLCRTSGKDVKLEIEGSSLELDRAILEELAVPLTHMLRNAVDHGIEQQGTVQVRAWRERDQVLLQVADDGRGIDPQLVRQRAVSKQLISPAQAQTMRDFDVLQLICQPGFSTAEQITETSGRGVGMDVVKNAVERLGGVLMIDSTLGEGTRITMKLPLSVAIIRVLMIDCAGSLVGIPITRVLQTVEITPQEVQTSGKQLVISLHGELVPLLSLRKIMGQPKGAAGNNLSLVVSEIFGRRIALVVDSLVGQQEVFVQVLSAPFDRLPGISGGAILGDGRIMFLLDLQSKLEKRRIKGA